MTIIVAGGGTGGHVFPGIAIADEIRRRDPAASILFIGTMGRIEARVVPAHGYRFSAIWISGFQRTWGASTLLFPLKVIVSLVQSLVLILRMRPDVLVGTGGYVCGPPLAVGMLLGIPTLVQEQNSTPGITTRLLAPRATEVHLTFAASAQYLKRKDNVHVTGTPTRAVIGALSREEGATALGIVPQRRTVLVTGGSQGAASINAAMLAIVGDLMKEGVQVIWHTGDADYERINEAVRAMRGGEGTIVHRFIERMECALAAADLAVCRAGATTLAELTRAGVPSVLVPYPFAAGDHQTANAKAMEDGGAAVVVRDADAQTALKGIVLDLVRHPGRLQSMAERARALSNPRATEDLADAVVRLAVHTDSRR
jgi:UDP-N-acetylglucosamine--N-acetylmuramyl-(pentapeptide) pyrophosphoryl-undecaprenol N-acetylglucosamine transferase